MKLLSLIFLRSHLYCCYKSLSLYTAFEILWSFLFSLSLSFSFFTYYYFFYIYYLFTFPTVLFPLQLIFNVYTSFQFSSVQFSGSVVPDSLWPHEPQHARPPCPSPTPGVQPNPCPSSWWCHPTISSSVVRFSSCSQSFPASGPFPMSQLFTSGGQSIGISASTSVLPMNTQDWTPLEWTGWIYLQSKGLSRVICISI